MQGLVRILTVIFLLQVQLFAQNQGSDLGLGSAGTKVFGRVNEAEAALASSDGQANFVALSKSGKVMVTLAAPGQSWYACSAVATGTSTTVIKSAVAGKRIYVTSLSCYNNSTTSSIIEVYDGAYAGNLFLTRSILGPNTAAHSVWHQSFPVPLRGSVNTDLNFAMATTSTSSRCCAAGYTSAN